MRTAVSLAAALLLLGFGAGSIEAQSLGWPLQNHYGVTATFGESRVDHFHGGVDLSTRGQTGLPVVATADGWIYRLKIQRRGYGRALYIKHANGLSSVYAHLDRYSSSIGLEQMYQRKRAQTGNKYPGDIFIEPPIAVKRGDIVAYSGESGAGLPHLHFEVRKGEGTVVNPFEHGLVDSQDNVAPVFQAVHLYPVGDASTIDQDVEPKTFRFSKIGGQFAAAYTPAVTGTFMVSVSVYDGTTRPYRRLPKTIELFIDDRENYKIDFKQFSLTNQGTFGLVFDLGQPGFRFHEQPLLMGNLSTFDLPFASAASSVRNLNLAPGLHKLRLTARDANGNSSTAIATINVVAPILQRPVEFADGMTTPAGQLKWKSHGGAIKVFYDVSQPVNTPVYLRAGNSHYLMQHENGSYTAIFWPQETGNRIQIQVGTETQIIPMDVLHSNKPSDVTSAGFTVQFPAGSLFYDTRAAIHTIPSYVAAELPFASPILVMKPAGIPTRKSARVVMDLEPGQSDLEKLSIYAWNQGTQRWQSLPSKVNAATRTIAAQIDHFTNYAVLYDNIKPAISSVLPANNAVTNRTPRFAARVTDRGMEVNDEKIFFVIDGRRYSAEYDPDHSLASLDLPIPLEPGSHTFAIEAYDWGGNITTSNIAFRVR